MAENTYPSTGQVTIVTGGSAGIGFEIARQMARRGHNLVLVARDVARLREAKAAIEREHGVSVWIVALDLAASDAVSRLETFLAQNKLTVRYLVNNAGWGRIGPFMGQDRSSAPDMVDVNCRAVVLLTHAFLPQIIANRGGMLNVASVAGFLPGPGMATYFATKAFIVSLTRALAHELKAQPVLVCALCPGPSPTRFQSRAGMWGGQERPLISLGPAVIAAHGVEGFLAGRLIVVPGFWNWLLAKAGRYVPGRILSHFVARYHRLSGERGLRGAGSAELKLSPAPRHENPAE